MPLPLSPTSGFGMKVSVLPWPCATFHSAYLRSCTSSPFFVSVFGPTLISPWPPVPTSW